MASRPDETIAAQEYANSVPHLDLLQKKRREIDAEIKQTETTQEDAMKILRKCVPELHDTKIYAVSGDALLVITHIAAAGDKNVLFKITKPENMPIKKPQQPMAEAYVPGRTARIPPVVKGVAAEILARLPADMKVGREIVQEAAEACAEPPTNAEILNQRGYAMPAHLDTVNMPAQEGITEAEMIDHG